MANVSCFKYYMAAWVPPDGTYYWAIGPDDRLGSGAVTVTCHANEGVAGLATRYLEVVQTATRRQYGTHYTSYLDLVLRNNGHVGGSGSGFDTFTTYLAIVNP